MKKTALFDFHLQKQAKMIVYANFMMPEQFSGIIKEHNSVRTDVGVFDCSHMGEFILEGKESLNFLNYVLSNDYTSLEIGKIRYGLLLDESGYVLDDLMVYKLKETIYMLVVNASNIDKDFVHLVKYTNEFDVKLRDVSNEHSLISIQGPNANQMLEKLLHGVSKLKFMQFDHFAFHQGTLLVSRSGYTGEDGFEVYGKEKEIVQLYDQLVNVESVLPCGLGSRDTLRFEAGLPLYGHEINGYITPLEARLESFCHFDKDFIGRDALLILKENGVKKRLVGLELLEKNIAREGYMVFKNDKNVGYITTGYMIPMTNKVYANALIDAGISLGDVVEINIRNKMIKAKVRNRKYYTKKYVKGDK